MFTRLRSHLPAVRRALRRRRRALAVLLALTLTALALPPLLGAVLPPSARGATVVLAAEDLPAGTELSDAELTTAVVAEDLVPPGAAVEDAALEGRRLAVDVPAGSPVLPTMLHGDDELSLAPSEALMVVPAPAELTEHLTAGSPVELLAATPELPRPRAVRARVVAVSAPAGDGALVTDTTTGRDVQVTIRLDRADTGDIAHALREGWLTVSIIG